MENTLPESDSTGSDTTESDRKVCVITGCSSGLGLSLAVELARRSHIVVATMRDLAKQDVLREAIRSAAISAESNVSIAELDVQDTASVNSLVAQVLQEHSRIDVLVNNAGVGCLSSTEEIGEAQVKQVMDINLLGVIRCTQAVIGHMRRARSGHVVNISSLGGVIGQPFNEIYCASKFAVEGYTAAMASYIEPAFGIHFTSIQAGRILTDFGTHAVRASEVSDADDLDDYLPIREKYLAGVQKRALPENKIAQTAEQVAVVVADCIELESPPIHLATSDWMNAMCRIKTAADPTGRRMQQAVIDVFLEGGSVG